MKLTAILLFLFSYSCSTIDNTAKEAMQAKVNKVITDPYTLDFHLEKEAEDSYTLVTSIELVEGAHIASPFSNNNWTGLFKIMIDESNNLLIDSTLIETPRSTEERDKFGQFVNRIRVNTSYQQKLNVLSKEDFVVSGLVSFTIEPRCTKEDIPFTISYMEGELLVKKN